MNIRFDFTFVPFFFCYVSLCPLLGNYNIRTIPFYFGCILVCFCCCWHDMKTKNILRHFKKKEAKWKQRKIAFDPNKWELVTFCRKDRVLLILMLLQKKNAQKWNERMCTRSSATFFPWNVSKWKFQPRNRVLHEISKLVWDQMGWMLKYFWCVIRKWFFFLAWYLT